MGGSASLLGGGRFFRGTGGSSEAGGQLSRGEFDEDGIFADALEALPRDAVGFGFIEVKESGIFGEDDGGDGTCGGVDFEVGG